MAQVLAVPAPHDSQRFFPISHSQSSLSLGSSDLSIDTSPHLRPSSELATKNDSLRSSQSQPSLLPRNSSFVLSPPSTLSLNTHISDDDDDEDVDEISFPSYHATELSGPEQPHQPSFDLESNEHEPKSNAPTPDIATPIDDADAVINPVADDIDVKQEPSRQVDYLSHDWREEDIWSSWRHIVRRRKLYGEQSRLENASWRTWTKQKYGLRTVSPETLNWLKDYDVTWLYGPLQEAPRNRRHSEPSSHLSKNPSFLNKKPILKKRSVSEEMLQKSISSSSLVKQAAAAVQAQRSNGSRTPSRPMNRLKRCASDFDGATNYTGSTGTADISSTLPSSTSSGLVSPEASAKRRIRFDNNVEQCIAVDFKEGGLEEEANPEWLRACSDEESDEDLPTIKTKSKSRASRTSSSRSSFSSESKGIAKLPSTTLKFHHEEFDCRGHPIAQFSSHLRSPALSPSPSQETLKPSKQSPRFLLDGQDEGEMDWEPSGAFGNLRRDSISGGSRPELSSTGAEDETLSTNNGLRRTPSGMFMPFEEGQDDGMASSGFLGRVADTVNTARDICYVLYNVGWRK